MPGTFSLVGDLLLSVFKNQTEYPVIQNECIDKLFRRPGAQDDL